MMSHSIKLSSEADLKILEIQLLLAKKLKKKVSKKHVVTTALKALEEKMGLIVEGKNDGDE
ncbi:hypothetical protein [Pontibacter virosus]|uniref:Uncharacterized protein n=1 Tax=Pontibacter virosus TaxID=1765052 RepID=A0A2U1B3R3_9BACT|nr:hypothetical protein [Pontibacter virosus]PVY43157.1 hypothetical protein C8E01_102334 [Pontibacter virosus]